MLYLWIVYISPNVFIHSKNVYLHLKHNIFSVWHRHICNSISITFIWLQAKLFVCQTKTIIKTNVILILRELLPIISQKEEFYFYPYFGWYRSTWITHGVSYCIHFTACVEILAVLTNYRQNYVCYQKICTC